MFVPPICNGCLLGGACLSRTVFWCETCASSIPCRIGNGPHEGQVVHIIASINTMGTPCLRQWGTPMAKPHNNRMKQVGGQSCWWHHPEVMWASKNTMPMTMCWCSHHKTGNIFALPILRGHLHFPAAMASMSMFKIERTSGAPNSGCILAVSDGAPQLQNQVLLTRHVPGV